MRAQLERSPYAACALAAFVVGCSSGTGNTGSGGTSSGTGGSSVATGGASSGTGGVSAGTGGVSAEPWECWIGADPQTTEFCTCWQSDLEPFEGSGPIGTSCSQSANTDYACCVHSVGFNCECKTDDAMNECEAALPEELVPMCPPGG